MPVTGPCSLKRIPSDEADAIILTFSHRWADLLLSGKIECVFRKQGPSNFTPKLMYAYVSAPTGAIICRSTIVAYSTMPVAKAITFAERGCIDVSELKDYAKTSRDLIVIEVGEIFAAKSPITRDFLSTHHNFWPSSTFIPLSKSGVAVLDELGKFPSKSIRRKHGK